MQPLTLCFVLMARAAATFKQVIKTQKWGSASALCSAIDYSWSAVAIESAIMFVFQQRCSCVVSHLQYSEESGLDAHDPQPENCQTESTN